jgi:DNA polymerase elongation subunit (family B)
MDQLLYGQKDNERIVGIHEFAEDQMRLYFRTPEDEVIHVDRTFKPFGHFSEDAAELILEGYDVQEVRGLSGPGYRNRLVRFETFHQFWSAKQWLKGQDVDQDDYYVETDLRKQFLMKTGHTMFGGMQMDDIHRMQVDLEVYSSSSKFPNAERPGDEIIIISITDNRGREVVLHQNNENVNRDSYDPNVMHSVPSEKALLIEFVKSVHRYDPDVLEFHNGFGFDLPYLDDRADLKGVKLTIGRDNSEPKKIPSKKSFAEREQEYTNFIVAGRSIIDSYFLAADFDVFARDLPSYGLKDLAKYFGFASEDRTYVPGDKISDLWRSDPMRLLEYALDDVRDTRSIVEKLGNSNFVLTKILPADYQGVMTLGTAGSIEILMVREYLRRDEAIPVPEEADPPAGGYTEVFLRGSFRDLAYADVSSLYPTNMLLYGVNPDRDSLNIFRPLLEKLTDMRLETKKEMRSLEDGPRKDTLDAQQQAYKVLINCFTPDHEIMTREGRKRVGDVEKGDYVPSLNPATGETEWKKVTRTYRQENYTGEMVEINNSYVDLKVTPNHRMLTKKIRPSVNSDDKQKWREAKQLFESKYSHELPECSRLEGGNKPETFYLSNWCEKLDIDYRLGKRGIKGDNKQCRWFPNEYCIENVLRLMGWYVSEGHIYHAQRKEYTDTVRGESWSFTISNKTENERNSIKTLLKEMGLSYSESDNGFEVGNPIWPKVLRHMFGKGSGNKRLPQWILDQSAQNLEVFFETMYQGDGDKRGPKNGRWRYTTKSRQLSLDVQQLCLQLGWRTRITKDSGVYRIVIFRNSRYGSSPWIKASDRKKVDYSGPLVCVEVEDNHTVYAGRNGKLNWVGQSHYGALAFQWFVFNDYEDAATVTRKGRQILKRLIHIIRDEGGRVILTDTDGVMFELPEEDMTDDEVDALIADKISSRLPEGVEIDNDGRFEAVASYKPKNYAKLPAGDDDLSIKGNSLVGRGIEPFLREYIQRQLWAVVRKDVQKMFDTHETWKHKIWTGEFGIDELKKRGRLKKTMSEYADSPASLARYEVAKEWAERTGQEPLAGDTFWYYVSGTEKDYRVYKKATLAADYEDGDENPWHYLGRLDATADMFRSMVSDPQRIFNMEVQKPDQPTLFSGPPDLSGVEVVEKRLEELPPNPSDSEIQPKSHE